MSIDGTLVLVDSNGDEKVVSPLKMQSFNNTIESIYDFEYFESLVNILEKNTGELERYLEKNKFHKNLYENQYGLRLQIEIQRLYLNLASSQRAFVDTLQKTISKRGRESDLKAFKASISEQYDTNLGYKMIDGLRNFSQHQTLLPITISQSGSELRFKVERKVILDSKDISASLRSALEANTDIDLQDLISRWKESCEVLHSSVRALFVGLALDASKKLISISSLSPDPKVLMRYRFRAGNEVYELPLPLETAKSIIKLQPSL